MLLLSSAANNKHLLVANSPWLIGLLCLSEYRLHPGLPPKGLLGVTTDDSDRGVRGVEGVVALWDKLMRGGTIGNVAWGKDTLGTIFTWNSKNRNRITFLVCRSLYCAQRFIDSYQLHLLSCTSFKESSTPRNVVGCYLLKAKLWRP